MSLPALESEHILVKIDGAVMEITLNRPDKLNALTGAMYRDMVRMLDHAEQQEALTVVLFSAEGKAFAAGNDLDDFLQVKPGEVGEAAHFIQALYRFPKLVVAAVQGSAVGVGLTMLLHTDQVVAADDAKLLAPFVNLGLTPEAGSSKLLPDWIGYQRAARMLLLGEPMLAAEAEQAGLVTKVVAPDALPAAAREVAQALAKKPRPALLESKRLMRSSIGRPLDAVLDEEMELFAKMLQGEDAKAILTAFLNR